MQPFISPSGSRLICNGELYNYRDLTNAPETLRSDCDAILTLLDAVEGKEAIQAKIQSLDGDFAFVYENRVKGVFVIARDPVGVAPLFYGCDASGELVAAASEAKALLGVPGISEVRVFPPGHFWHNSTLSPYVEVPVEIHPSREEAVTKIRELVKAAVKKRIDHSERPVGVLCSGGIDSSIVACLVAEMALQERIHVFTMEYEGARSEDAFYARILCQKLGLKHTVFSFKRSEVREAMEKVIKQCETYDPNTVRAAIPMYLLAHKIAKTTDVRVILSGEGADELFHGYNYFRMAPDGSAARTEAARLVKNLHMFDLLRAERCFSSAGLEVRVPFLDRELISYTQSLGGELFRGSSGQYAEKQLLRDAFAYIDTLGAMRILDRPKERFSDGCGFSYVPQLLSDLSNGADFLHDRLAVEKAHVAEIFDATYGSANHTLILSRTMPDWVVQTDRTEGMLGM